MVKPIADAAELKSIIAGAGDKLVVIDFHATWCGPCKVIGPKIKAMSEKYGDKAIFVSVDVDECDDISAEYAITAMPTIAFVKGGVELKANRVVGANEAKIKEVIMNNI